MNFYPYYNFPYNYLSQAPKVGGIKSILGGIKWSSILNGTQKTLNIVNQAIPIIKQAGPIVNNAKTMFRVMNEFKNIDNKTNENVSLQSNSIIESSTSQNNTNSTINKKTSYQSNQGPTFFQ
ncbi:MAG TPA: hypothetical protein IAC20_05955 [Candidatus Faecisoma merdavium]|nr:hypothetical protein [Candidatus Faecisoma merdavium]